METNFGAILLKFNDWLKEVTYLNYEILAWERGGVLYLQARWMESCSFGGEPQMQSSRQWMLHPNMTKNEVIQTAFKCCIAAAEHEVREAFKYRGQRVFGPHYDVDVLADLLEEQGMKALDCRKVA